MRGRNLGVLWDCFGGKYLTNNNEIRTVLGLGRDKVEALLQNTEVLAIGKGTYYRTLDVIDTIENSFVRKEV